MDNLLVELGLAPSRSKAQALLMSGVVYVDGQRVDKAGTRVLSSSEIELRGDTNPYVSRGGLKLEAALDAFGIDPQGLTAVDIGASTGGFTDCLLQRGAEKVYAVDVGRGQLDWKLRQDVRVVPLERVNARYLMLSDLGEPVDLAVLDVSFISLRKVIPPVVKLLKPRGLIVALIKPQFEVGRGEVGKGGIVRDPAKHVRVVEDMSAFIASTGLTVQGVVDSPILGAGGNREFLICARLPRG